MTDAEKLIAEYVAQAPKIAAELHRLDAELRAALTREAALRAEAEKWKEQVCKVKWAINLLLNYSYNEIRIEDKEVIGKIHLALTDASCPHEARIALLEKVASAAEGVFADELKLRASSGHPFPINTTREVQDLGKLADKLTVLYTALDAAKEGK